MVGVTPSGESLMLTSLLTGVYISLHTGDPDVGNEIVGGGYARQAATFTNTGANPTTASNNGTVQFPTATALWGTVTHFGIFTAAVNGTLRYSGVVDTAKVVDIDDVVRFLAGQLKVILGDKGEV